MQFLSQIGVGYSDHWLEICTANGAHFFDILYKTDQKFGLKALLHNAPKKRTVSMKIQT